MATHTEDTRDTRQLMARTAQLNRYRHVPLIAGATIYWVSTAIIGKSDPRLLFAPVDIALQAPGPLIIFAIAGCVTPIAMMVAIVTPLVVAFTQMTTRYILLLAGVLGFVAIGNLVVTVVGMFSGMPGIWPLLIWHLGMLLLAVGCVTSPASADVFRNVMQCQACGYPLRASIEAGSKACPECGEAIPGSAFAAFDNLRARERTEAERTGRLSDTPTDLPPPPPPLDH